VTAIGASSGYAVDRSHRLTQGIVSALVGDCPLTARPTAGLSDDAASLHRGRGEGSGWGRLNSGA